METTTVLSHRLLARACGLLAASNWNSLFKDSAISITITMATAPPTYRQEAIDRKMCVGDGSFGSEFQCVCVCVCESMYAYKDILEVHA